MSSFWDFLAGRNDAERGFGYRSDGGDPQDYDYRRGVEEERRRQQAEADRRAEEERRERGGW